MNRKFIVYQIALMSFTALVSANERWNMVKSGDQTCWYKINKNQFLKKCQEASPDEEIIASPGTPTIQPQLNEKPSIVINPYLNALTSGVNQASNAIVNKMNSSKNNQIQPPSQQLIQATNPSADTTFSNNENKELFPIFWILTGCFVGYIVGHEKKKRSDDYIQHEAEILVKSELKKLDQNHYCVMYDITLPTEEGTTQIDHIVFFQKGIFVIETKSHKGWLFGQEGDGRWTQVTKGGRKYSFHSPIIQNSNHIKNIQKIANIGDGFIKNIVVFTNPNMEIKSSLPDYVLRLHKLNSYIENETREVIARPVSMKQPFFAVCDYT
ncbi:MAG: nuclease-related domain-containing protein [Methylococcales bacterium]